MVEIESRRVEVEGLTSIDWILAYVSRKVLTIPLLDHDEVCSLYGKEPTYAVNQYAVTHPSAEKCRREGYPKAGSQARPIFVSRH